MPAYTSLKVANVHRGVKRRREEKHLWDRTEKINLIGGLINISFVCLRKRNKIVSCILDVSPDKKTRGIFLTCVPSIVSDKISAVSKTVLRFAKINSATANQMNSILLISSVSFASFMLVFILLKEILAEAFGY